MPARMSRARQLSGLAPVRPVPKTGEILTMAAGKSPAPTVLVVDDDALVRWSLSESLSNAGYHVLEARDGQDALQQLGAREDHVEVVLLDMELPDCDDLQLLKDLRRRSLQCPIIMMTAHGTAEAAEQATREGAYRVVDKPFDLEDIVGLVAEAVGQPQL